MNIRSSLNADMAVNGKSQTPNDVIDIDRAAIGLRISDYFFADNEKKLAIERCQLDKNIRLKSILQKKICFVTNYGVVGIVNHNLF